MRNVEIWLSGDHRVYAWDSESLAMFWLPTPLHDQYPDAVQRAIALHDAEIIADFVAWLTQSPDGLPFEHVHNNVCGHSEYALGYRVFPHSTYHPSCED